MTPEVLLNRQKNSGLVVPAKKPNQAAPTNPLREEKSKMKSQVEFTTAEREALDRCEKAEGFPARSALAYQIMLARTVEAPKGFTFDLAVAEETVGTMSWIGPEIHIDGLGVYVYADWSQEEGLRFNFCTERQTNFAPAEMAQIVAAANSVYATAMSGVTNV